MPLLNDYLLSVSEAKVLLRWALQKGYPILPKSVKEERVAANFDLFSFALDDAQMASLDACDNAKPFAWKSATEKSNDPCLTVIRE
jgi:2,5-diketo-D-gluconate reductase A